MRRTTIDERSQGSMTGRAGRSVTSPFQEE